MDSISNSLLLTRKSRLQLLLLGGASFEGDVQVHKDLCCELLK